MYLCGCWVLFQFLFFVGGMWTGVWIFVIIFFGGGWGWGGGGVGERFCFQIIFFFCGGLFLILRGHFLKVIFSVLWWNFINILIFVQHSLIHSHNIFR